MHLFLCVVLGLADRTAQIHDADLRLRKERNATARRLDDAVVVQSGNDWRVHLDGEIPTVGMAVGERSYDGGWRAGKAEGVSRSGVRGEPAQISRNELSHWGEFFELPHAPGQPFYGAVVVPERVQASGKL